MTVRFQSMFFFRLGRTAARGKKDSFFLIRKGGMLEDIKTFSKGQKVTSNLSVRNEFYQSTHLTMFSIGSRSLRNRLIGASSSG